MADMEAATATAALETLHLSGWRTQMEQQIATMTSLMAERDELEAEKNIPTDKEAKTQLRKVIGEAVAELEALHRRERVAGLEASLPEIDEVIRRLNSIARARQTRKDNSTDAAADEAV